MYLNAVLKQDNFLDSFCKNIFGIEFNSVNLEYRYAIKIKYTNNDIYKKYSIEDVIDIININTDLLVIDISKIPEYKDIIDDDFQYKIIFKNGFIYEKDISSLILQCALISKAVI